MKVSVNRYQRLASVGDIFVVKHKNGHEIAYAIGTYQDAILLQDLSSGQINYSISKSRTVDELVDHYLGFQADEKLNPIVSIFFIKSIDATIGSDISFGHKVIGTTVTSE